MPFAALLRCDTGAPAAAAGAGAEAEAEAEAGARDVDRDRAGVEATSALLRCDADATAAAAGAGVEAGAEAGAVMRTMPRTMRAAPTHHMSDNTSSNNSAPINALATKFTPNCKTVATKEPDCDIPLTNSASALLLMMMRTPNSNPRSTKPAKSQSENPSKIATSSNIARQRVSAAVTMMESDPVANCKVMGTRG